MIDIRAISGRQPWPELLLASLKDIETRPRNTSYRGPFILHASKQEDKEAMKYYGYKEGELPTGALLGILNQKGVLTYNNAQEWIRDKELHKCYWVPESDEFPKYGSVMTPKRIRFKKPIPWKGQLGFWKLPEKELGKILEEYFSIKLKPEDEAWIKEMRAADKTIWICEDCKDLRAMPMSHPTIEEIPKEWDCPDCGKPLKEIKGDE